MRHTLPLLAPFLALLLAGPAVAQDGEMPETPNLDERAILERARASSSAFTSAAVSVPAFEVEAANSNNGTVATVFTVDQDGGLVAEGTLGIGTIPATGCGDRMMWYPYRGAFRAGTTNDGGSCTYWDEANIGFYSWAGGNLTRAGAFASFAFGDQVVVTGVDAAAFGASNVVSGTIGFAAGGLHSCSGFACVTLGYDNVASGQGSTAIGYRNTANANYATAIGHRASANGRTGAFVISDASTTDSTRASANNQFRARFAGGYQLYTNSSQTLGVLLSASGNSWSTISDSTQKEHVMPVSGEVLLGRLAHLPVSTWRYRAQEDPSIRHVGPMSQDWQRFVAGPLGLNTEETTINQADFDGVNLAGVIALEARTRDQAERIEALEAELAALRQTLAAERAGSDDLRQTVAAQASRLDALDARLDAVLAALDAAPPATSTLTADAD